MLHFRTAFPVLEKMLKSTQSCISWVEERKEILVIYSEKNNTCLLLDFCRNWSQARRQPKSLAMSMATPFVNTNNGESVEPELCWRLLTT